MAETNNDHDNLPQATVVPRKRRRVSAVWVIPILAALVAVGIAVQRILSEGPTITITMEDAHDIKAGKTSIKYKNVDIGQVTDVRLSEDHVRVTVTAKVINSAAALIVEDAKFWVVEPRVTLSGVSGISTLLSGQYIGFEAGKSTKKQHQFTALKVPPILTEGQPGRLLQLKSSSLGSLGVGAPIYYRSLQAGQVIAYDLSSDGRSIDVKIFVNAPYDQYINSDTRFWNASGIDVTLGSGGMKVRSESLLALLAGGVAFDQSDTSHGGQPVAANTTFTLFPSESAAMAQPDPDARRYVLFFDESLRGLSVGAPINLFGLPWGEVTDVGLDIDPATVKIRGRVEVVVYPERLTSRLNAKSDAKLEAISKNPEKLHALFTRLIEKQGLRAQLQTGNLLTGQRYIAFEAHTNLPKAQIDWSQSTPELPVLPSALPDAEEKIASILTKIDKLQFEKIGGDTDKLLGSLNQAVTRFDTDVTPEIAQSLKDFHNATAAAGQMIKSADATLVGKDAPGQQELRDALQEVAAAARSVRALTDYLERHPEALIRGKPEDKP